MFNNISPVKLIQRPDIWVNMYKREDCYSKYRLMNGQPLGATHLKRFHTKDKAVWCLVRTLSQTKKKILIFYLNRIFSFGNLTPRLSVRAPIITYNKYFYKQLVPLKRKIFHDIHKYNSWNYIYYMILMRFEENLILYVSHWVLYSLYNNSRQALSRHLCNPNTKHWNNINKEHNFILTHLQNNNDGTSTSRDNYSFSNLTTRIKTTREDQG